MSKIDITKLDDTQKAQLIENRWKSSSEIWDIVERTYKQNTAIYENRSEWLQYIPERRKKFKVQANRIFVNMEAVINSLIANPPGINILPSGDGVPSQDFASSLEDYFRKKYDDLNIKEVIRMGLRNLYFSRLIVIKPFWNTVINDFDFRSIDPRNIRVGKYARKEQDSEFAIEEIEDNLCAVIDRFPSKKKELMAKYGIVDDKQLYIKNPDVKYKEAWIYDYTIFKLDNIILDTIKNPYWDWDGIMISDEEEQQLSQLQGQSKRDFLQQIKLEQDKRRENQQSQQVVPPQELSALPVQDNQNVPAPTSIPNGPEGDQTQNPQEMPTNSQPPINQAPISYHPYYYNYFDNPRKPYIFATIFNNENTPIGRTDMINLASELQRGIDKRKMDIDENCELANGVLKVDASVMGKSDAQRIRFETKGIIWGKGVKDGVTRETGQALPPMVFEDMQDSRSEIDNIMAASSAFRGEREGQETKAGRLALVQQSYLRLNELIQVVDYTVKEMFDWGMQFSKTRYTEYHSVSIQDDQNKKKDIEIIQDDFGTGNKVVIIPGKTLPQDDESKFEQAQNDVKAGFISPIDYLKIAKYDNAQEMSKNAFLYKVSPYSQFDITDEERQKIPPPMPQSRLSEKIDFNELPPAAKVQFLARMGITVTEQQLISEGEVTPVSIAFKDLPVDGQIQAAAKAGITLDPNIAVGEKIKQHIDTQNQNESKLAVINKKTT